MATSRSRRSVTELDKAVTLLQQQVSQLITVAYHLRLHLNKMGYSVTAGVGYSYVPSSSKATRDGVTVETLTHAASEFSQPSLQDLVNNKPFATQL
jgi:hypothetical protein